MQQPAGLTVSKQPQAQAVALVNVTCQHAGKGRERALLSSRGLRQNGLCLLQALSRIALGATAMAGPQNWRLLHGTPEGSPWPRHLEGQTSRPVQPITISWSHPSTGLGPRSAGQPGLRSGPMGPWNFFYKRGLGHPGLGAVAGALAELDCPLLGVGGRLEMEHIGGMTPQAIPCCHPSFSPKWAQGMARSPPPGSGLREASLHKRVPCYPPFLGFSHPWPGQMLEKHGG